MQCERQMMKSMTHGRCKARSDRCESQDRKKKKGEERSGSFKLKDSFFELCVELSDDDLLCLL